jgi:hypothetical protein
LGQNRVRRKTHAPETGSRFCKTQLDVADSVAVRLGLHDHANNFLLGFFVGEKNELPGSELGRNSKYSAVTEDQHGLRAFGKWFALV